jgi:hypothetical protein
VQDRRSHCRNMHCNTAEELRCVCIAAIFVRDDNADLAARVDVRSDLFAGDRLEVRDFNLLANDAGLRNQSLAHSGIVERQSGDFLSGLTILVCGKLGNAIGKRDEVVVLGDEVRLAA